MNIKEQLTNMWDNVVAEIQVQRTLIFTTGLANDANKNLICPVVAEMREMGWIIGIRRNDEEHNDGCRILTVKKENTDKRADLALAMAFPGFDGDLKKAFIAVRQKARGAEKSLA